MTVECPYTLQWDATSPPKIASSCGSMGPPESSNQTASRSVQPFSQGSLVWQTDRQTDRRTDHATRSVTIGRIYVLNTYSTAMRPKMDLEEY